LLHYKTQIQIGFSEVTQRFIMTGFKNNEIMSVLYYKSKYIKNK